MMMQLELASEISCLLKKLGSGQSPKMKVVWVNFSDAVCLFFSTDDDLEMQALIWLSLVLFIEIWFGAIQFSASYATLRWLHIFKHHI